MVVLGACRSRGNQVAEKSQGVPLMEWQPIETAPKDGTPILGYFGRTAGDEPPDMEVVRFDEAQPFGGEWMTTMASPEMVDEPTHWMPLPSPPSSTAKE